MTGRPETPSQRQNAPQVVEGTGEGHFPPRGLLSAIERHIDETRTPAQREYERIGVIPISAEALAIMRATVADDGESVGNTGAETGK